MFSKPFTTKRVNKNGKTHTVGCNYLKKTNTENRYVVGMRLHTGLHWAHEMVQLDQNKNMNVSTRFRI